MPLVEKAKVPWTETDRGLPARHIAVEVGQNLTPLTVHAQHAGRAREVDRLQMTQQRVHRRRPQLDGPVDRDARPPWSGPWAGAAHRPWVGASAAGRLTLPWPKPKAPPGCRTLCLPVALRAPRTAGVIVTGGR